MIQAIIFRIYVIVFVLAIRAASVFSPKIRRFVASRAKVDWKAQLSGDEVVLWIHASSRGELEALAPLLSRLEMRGPRIEVILTGFSPSLDSVYSRVRTQFSGVRFRYLGPSPSEGDWEYALSIARPAAFISYKYDAWPELWRGLGKLRISTAVISAGSRGSLRVIARLARWGFLSIPPLTLFCVTDREAEEAGRLFGTFPVRVPEIRWDRQSDLNVSSYPSMPPTGGQPIVALGSVYLEDLEWIFSPERIREFGYTATEAQFVIFPHRLEAENIRRITEWMAKVPVSHSVVTQPGKLASFYAVSDIAWVGGGFNHGIHSTIQPAFHGLPIFCGPKNVDNFSETAGLRASGQLHVCATVEDVLSFWRRIEEWAPDREAFERDGHRRRIRRDELGAADRIFERMVGTLPGSGSVGKE